MSTTSTSDNETNIDSDCQSDDDRIVGQNYSGVSPYMFEPRFSNVPVESDVDATNCRDHVADDAVTAVSADNDSHRLGNTEWCTCTHCTQMATEIECKCCQDVPQVWALILEVTEQLKQEGKEADMNCITEHPGFESACLNVYTLRIAYLHYRQQYGNMNRSQHEIYRYCAYRQLVRWGWGYLGKHHRVTLPSCAVSKIRERFPDIEGNYGGFKWPNL